MKHDEKQSIDRQYYEREKKILKTNNIDELLDKNIIFIVNKLDIHYKKPVLLDQLIKIESSLSELKKASFSFNQQVFINSEIMCEANVLCGCVDLETKKPIALPEELRKRMLDKKNAS